MNDTRYELPPLRDLPLDRLEERKEHLVAEISIARKRPGWALRPVPLVAAAALAASVAVGVVLATRVGTTTASAAQVRAKLAQGLDLAESIRGEYTVRTRPSKPVRHRHGCVNCRPAAPTPLSFVLGADGSYAIRTLPRDAAVRADIAYDARTGVRTSYQQGQVRGLRLYVRATHLDPAAPRSMPEYQLSAWVRQALTARDPHVRNVSFEGRPAWELTLTFSSADDLLDYLTYGARVDAVVDRATGLVVQVTRYADSPDRWTSIETVRGLTLGAPTATADFVITKPPGAQAVTHDYGFHHTSVRKAAAILGYRPVLPTATGGRRLTEFAVATITSERLLDFPAPVYRDVASARYGRGPSSIVVSTRRGRLTDVLPLLEGMTSQTVKLRRGALAGAFVQLSTSPPFAGYLVGYVHGLVVQVTAPSTSEAIAVAESLAAAR